MSVLAPHPVTATTFEKEDPFNIEQRRRLEEFSCKFSKYLPTFDVGVLRKHLLFLKATYRVFSSIDKPFVVEDKINDRKAPTPATRVFLSKALHRFEVWLNQVVNHRTSNKPLDEDELPPLDVLIILHGYRLAPWIYDEDLNRRFPQLAKIGNFPFDNIVRKLDVITAEYQPSLAQIEKWEEMTGLPFDASAMGNTVFITCPACRNSLSVPWTCGPTACDGGTGFAETGFAVNCPKCDLDVNHDALATAKFVRDLIACQDMEDAVLPGTLISGNGSAHVEMAKIITAEIKKTLGASDCYTDLGTKLSWSMKTIATLIQNDPDSRIKKSKIADVLRPYQQVSPFSTDLVYKAAIQGEFAARTNAKGFFEEDFLQQENNPWLAGAIKTYRLFIKLVLMPHMPKVYPTYAIDLVWHTHQLSADYKAQVLDIVGVFVDHRSHDEIAPTSAAFEAARDAWKGLLLAAGLPPLESYSGLTGRKRGSSPSGCSSSASQALKEDSVLALELLDDTTYFIDDPPALILSPLEVKEALAN